MLRFNKFIIIFLFRECIFVFYLCRCYNNIEFYFAKKINSFSTCEPKLISRFYGMKIVIDKDISHKQSWCIIITRNYSWNTFIYIFSVSNFSINFHLINYRTLFVPYYILMVYPHAIFYSTIVFYRKNKQIKDIQFALFI